MLNVLLFYDLYSSSFYPYYYEVLFFRSVFVLFFALT